MPVLGPFGTPTSVTQRLGPSPDAIAAFTDFAARDARPGESWFDDLQPPVSGDGTVPLDSSVEMFVGDPRVTLKPFTRGGNTQGLVGHTDLLSNFEVQKTILETLGVTFQPSNISTDRHGPSGYAISMSAFIDPVEGFVVDGLGRRLGFTTATGAVTEIPDSVWFGNVSGIGFVLGPVEEPLMLQLAGRGEPYYVMVSLNQGSRAGGLVDVGFLAPGASLVLPIPTSHSGIQITAPAPGSQLPSARPRRSRSSGPRWRGRRSTGSSSRGRTDASPIRAAAAPTW